MTDKNFKPCKCGYQVCLWCWHSINEKLNGKCPACRTAYDPEKIEFTAPDPKQIQRAMKEKKVQKKTKSEGETNPSGAPGLMLDKERDLSNVRVLQRNLVYVVGLPPSIAREEILRKKEYFGKFGKIIKVAVNRKQTGGVSHSTFSSYVTFKKTEDAKQAILAINGCTMESRVVRATYGTTKYCTYFLRKIPCNNPNCLYVHEMARPEDCFTKEDLSMTDRFADPINLVSGHVSHPGLPPPPSLTQSQSTPISINVSAAAAASSKSMNEHNTAYHIKNLQQRYASCVCVCVCVYVRNIRS